jgi:hypothetical protein
LRGLARAVLPATLLPHDQRANHRTSRSSGALRGKGASSPRRRRGPAVRGKDRRATEARNRCFRLSAQSHSRQCFAERIVSRHIDFLANADDVRLAAKLLDGHIQVAKWEDRIHNSVGRVLVEDTGATAVRARATDVAKTRERLRLAELWSFSRGPAGPPRSSQQWRGASSTTSSCCRRRSAATRPVKQSLRHWHTAKPRDR